MKTTKIIRLTSTLIITLALCIGSRGVRAVDNDNFASAWTISAIPYSLGTSNVDATRETGEPYHYGSTNGRSVWWTWTAPASGPMQVNTTNSGIRTVVGVYTGVSVGGLTQVSAARGNHIVDFVAVAGTTYRIAADSLDANTTGNFTLRLSDNVPPPANDLFTNATVISGTSYVLSGASNAGATKEPGEPAHCGDLGGKSLWWKWTAPVSGTFQLDTLGSALDTLLAVYNGSSVSALSLVASNDNYTGFTSLVNFSAVAGTTYWFAVDGWQARQGAFNLNLNPPPPNDHFSNATVLVGSTVNVSNATSVAATLETGEPLHAGNSGGHSVWFRWTAPASGLTQVDTMGSGFDTLLGVYTGTQVNSLATLASNDNWTNLQSLVTFMATAGTTYSIAVDGWNGASGSVILHVTGQTPTGPLNDYFANATVVTGTNYSLTNASTVGATLEPGEPNHNVNYPGGSSVWWAWTAPFTGPAQVDLATTWYPFLAVYTGSSVSNLTLVGRVWGSSVNFNATSGTVYRIAVDAYLGYGGDFNLSVQPGPPAPSNDNFTNALVISSFPYATNNISTVSASKEAGEPNHHGSVGGKSVWWKWTAAASGRMQMNTTNSNVQTVVGIYAGSSVGSLISVASGYGNHTVYFQATAGTTYMIAVDDSHGMGGSVKFSFNIAPAPPANDPFASAVVLSGSVCTVSNVSNVAASMEPGEPNHAGEPGGKSVWWRWTAPASGQTQVDTIGSGFDTILGVYTGSSVSGLTEIASDDQSGGSNTSKTNFNAVAGTTYYIAVDGWHAQEGNIVLHVIGPTPTGPANDLFVNATVVTLSGTYYGVNGVYNTNATKEAGEPNHTGNAGGKSLWWSWAAMANGSCHVDTIGSAFNTLLGVYTGSAVNGLTEIASNDDSSMMPPASELSFNVVSGTTYRIAVDGYNGANGWISMNLIFAAAVPLHFESAGILITNSQTYFQYQLAGTVGSTAVVQSVSSLLSTNWTPVATNILLSSPMTVTLPNAATDAQRFFRAKAAN